MDNTVFPLRYRLLIFFASNPDTKITTAELAYKYSDTLKRVSETLRYWREHDVIIPVPGKRRKPLLYCAGPRMWEELGADFNNCVDAGV